MTSEQREMEEVKVTNSSNSKPCEIDDDLPNIGEEANMRASIDLLNFGLISATKGTAES